MIELAQKKRKKTNQKSTRRSKTQAAQKESGVKIRFLGIVLIVLALYSAYSFTTATPGAFDQIWGKGILSYVMGNVTTMYCLVLLITGVLLTADKWEQNKQLMLYVFLLVSNFIIVFSLNYPKMFNYSLIDMFSIAKYGGYGGIVGMVLTYILRTIIGKAGTILVVVVLAFFELYKIIKIKFPESFDQFKKKSSNTVKGKIDQLKEDRELTKKRKVAEEKREEKKELEDQNYDGLFNPSDIGEVSVNTQYVNVDDVINGLDDQEAKEAQKERQAVKEAASHDHLKDDDLTQVLPDIDAVMSGEKTLLGEYHKPDVALLNPGIHKGNNRKSDVVKKAKHIETTLNDFGVDAKIIGVDVGPSITRFEVQPAPGVKVGKIVNLADDLALSLATSDIRMEAPIPGKSAVGIEVPNKESDIVSVREIIDTPAFKKTKANLPFALGKTLSGQNIVGDISKMPHVLIAGATGSGKSVCINTMIISLLYKCSPEDLRFIMIDPKMVELNQYNSIPHMLIPVVTDPRKASYALNWGIKEMTDRYQKFKDAGVRDIEGFNKNALASGKVKLPRIVIVVDELADLMMTSPKEVENAICRIAQLARACGIHLVIATQRPSVDVITGLIKANIPSRIAFSVASNTDSRTILDQVGAEKLLGKGDMLYFPVGKSKPLRVQGTFVSDAEINRVVQSVSGGQSPTFDNHIEDVIEQYQESSKTEETEDDLFPQAAEIAFSNGTISTSMVQRKLRVGYARAGRIIDELETRGIISGPNGSKPRKCLMTREEYHG
ncbi:MAG: DNA translocase FtsK 4TM domain-containing protein [Eubacteriaceae bacterium]|nr:DNA translocase FtsK 4TM domain-containing protein [Eubacteriaceae bacterium]MDD4507452.1 DNA translocase FtsK 4TM domain-containing protein [Eubacteriaceae bacterium]